MPCDFYLKSDPLALPSAVKFGLCAVKFDKTPARLQWLGPGQLSFYRCKFIYTDV